MSAPNRLDIAIYKYTTTYGFNVTREKRRKKNKILLKIKGGDKIK